MRMSNAPELQPVLDRIDADFDNSLERLFALLRIKSISADPAFAGDCKAAADHLARDIASLGFKTDVRPTAGHPAIVAKASGSTGGRPHVLFYGHYDVQPVDPLNLWHRPPFEPVVADHADGRKIIVARGRRSRGHCRLTSPSSSKARKKSARRISCRSSKRTRRTLRLISRWSATPACGTRTRRRSQRSCAGSSMTRSRSRPPAATCIPAFSVAARKIRSGC